MMTIVMVVMGSDKYNSEEDHVAITQDYAEIIWGT